MSRPGFGKCALIVAHPGHEIRVHGWLEATRPTVYVLTDGSGRASASRLASTTRLLAAAGARFGTIYGRFPDRVLYERVLRHDSEFFRGLASELAGELARERIDFVLGDAAEGAILAHDVWRGVIDAAIEAAAERLARPIANYDFTLEGPLNHCPDELAGAAIWHRLDDVALARKITAARAYIELREEVESALATYGPEAFGAECLRQVRPRANREGPPAYERHGEALVAEGVYPAVVRYRQHVAPLLEALGQLPKAA